MRVRGATLADVPAIGRVHCGSDGPWVDPVACAVHVNHRLLRPFLCRVLERRGQVLGHAEWIVGREPDRPRPFLYLGMLQVRADSRRQGVGRLLVEDGLDLARPLGCDALRTVPDDGAVGFYLRCGFARAATAPTLQLPIQGDRRTAWRRARSVPVGATRRLPMRLGWVQACAAHMWEICNRPCVLANEVWRHPCLKAPGADAWVQLRCGDATQALALAWADRDAPLEELLAAAHALASRRGIESLVLALPPGDRGGIDGAAPAGEVCVLERSVPVDTRRRPGDGG